MATAVTFAMSAFWHGLYPGTINVNNNNAGYYFTFLSLSFFTSITRYCRRHIRPLFLHRLARFKVAYDIAGWFSTHFILAYIMSAFFIRGFEKSVYVYAKTWYHGHLILLGTWLFFQLGGIYVLKVIRGPEVPKTEAAESVETKKDL